MLCRPAAPAAVSIQILREEPPALCVLYSDSTLGVWDARRRKQLLHVPALLESGAVQQASLKLLVCAHDAQVRQQCLQLSSLLNFSFR